MRNIIMAVIGILIMVSVAYALPDTTVQTNVLSAEATGSVIQDVTNEAAVNSDNAIVIQSVIEVGVAEDTVTQSATNDATTNGKDIWVGQEVNQGGQGTEVTQVGNNNLGSTGDNLVSSQAIVQAGDSPEVSHTANNMAVVNGNDAMTGQLITGGIKGGSATQSYNNKVTVVGNNPTVTQVLASSGLLTGDIVFGLSGNPNTNTLYINEGSEGGLLAQDIKVTTVGNDISQIVSNLVIEVP